MVQNAPENTVASSSDPCEKSTLTTSTATVRGDIVNQLNQSSVITSCCDGSLTYSNSSFSFAECDTSLDLGGGLKLRDPGSRIVGGLDSVAPQFRTQQLRGFDERSDYFCGQLEKATVTDSGIRLVGGISDSNTGNIKVNVNGQSYEIYMGNCDGCSNKLAIQFHNRDYYQNALGFNREALQQMSDNQTEALLQMYPDRAELIRAANKEWWRRYDQQQGGGDGGDSGQPIVEKVTFDKMFMDNVRKTYAETGNSSKFYDAFQKNMTADLQRRADNGEISQADVDAFKKYVTSGDYMKDVRNLFTTDASNPKAFWQKLEDRAYDGIKRYREDIPTPPKPDDKPDDNPNPPGPTPDNGSVKEARDRLHKSLEGNLAGDRLTRFDEMMKQFEKRGSERVEALVAAGKDRATVEKEWNDKIKKTYDQLNEMVNGNSSVGLDKATRTKLAENAMYLFMDPSKENQGQHGTCWLEGPINLGMVNNPEDMARLLKEVTLTGKYTDKNGQSYNIPSNYLQFSGEEASWSISNADNGYRSPVGALFDRTLAAMCGRNDGGTNGGDPSVSHDLIKRVTGQDFTIVQIRDNNLSQSDIDRLCSTTYRKQMLEQGGILVVSSNHEFVASLKKNNGNWIILGDNQWGAQNDQIIGRVNNLSSWDVTRTRERYTPDHNIRATVTSSYDTPVGVSGKTWNGNVGSSDVNAVLPRGTREVFNDENQHTIWAPQRRPHTNVPDGMNQRKVFNRREHDQHAEDFRKNHEQLMRRLRTSAQ